MTESCETCRFFSPVREVCRREPPKIVVLTDLSGNQLADSRFPDVPSAEWCGEYKPLPDEAMRKANDAGQSKP